MNYKRKSEGMFPSVEINDNEDLFPITLPCSLKRKRSSSPPPTPILSAKRMMVLEPIKYKPQNNYAKTVIILTMFLAVLSLQFGYKNATKLYGSTEYLIGRVTNIPNTFELRF
uniref:Uncharacterized protein n=1 Tax=viral metagenome TaxID=1070528 RepID=A0A6C0FB56_9ZZZZ